MLTYPEKAIVALAQQQSHKKTIQLLNLPCPSTGCLEQTGRSKAEPDLRPSTYKLFSSLHFQCGILPLDIEGTNGRFPSYKFYMSQLKVLTLQTLSSHLASSLVTHHCSLACCKLFSLQSQSACLFSFIEASTLPNDCCRRCSVFICRKGTGLNQT